jgi:hypothetical protein
MANKKISQLTPKGSALAGTDLVEVSVFNGVTYDTKSLTGANVVSGLQPTLFSGTNIKTINSTSLLGSGDIAISTGLTVGTTAIASGTVGRVLFQGTGNVVQEDSALFWDNTNKRLGVGATPATDVRLDVRAQGTLVTDIAFRVRNSADTANIVTIQGDGAFTVGTYTSPNTKLSVTGTSFGAYITGNTGIYAQCNTTSGTLYAIDCLGRASSGANTSYGIRATSDTTGVGSTNYGGRFVASNGTTNYAGYFDAYGGTNNYALVTQRGFSGFNKIDPSAIVDIKAAGALSTDIALRVRNSADTTNIFQVNGDAGIVCNGRIGLNMAANASADLIMTAGSGSSYGIFAIGTYGTAAISARPDTTTTQYNFYAPACANFGAYRAENSGGGTTVTAARIGFSAGSFNANAFDNIGFKCDIANSGGGGSIALDIANGNFRFGTTTGTKIGTATTEKFAFWNATPIVQPTTAVAAAAFVSNTSLIANDTATFDGYTIGQVVKALRNTGILA